MKVLTRTLIVLFIFSYKFTLAQNCALTPVTYCDTVDVYMLKNIVYKTIKGSGKKNGFYWYNNAKKDWQKIILTKDTTLKVRINEASADCDSIHIAYSTKNPKGVIEHYTYICILNENGEPIEKKED